MIGKRVAEMAALVVGFFCIYAIGRLLAAKVLKKAVKGGPFSEKRLSFWITMACLILAVFSQCMGIPFLHWIFLAPAVLALGIEGFAPFQRRKPFYVVVCIFGVVCSFAMAARVFSDYEFVRGLLGDGSMALTVKNTWLMLLVWCTVAQLGMLGSQLKFAGNMPTDRWMALPGYALGGACLIPAFCWLIVIYGMQSEDMLWEIVVSFITQPVHILNILLVIALVLSILFLLGNGLGTLVNVLLLGILFLANYIKLTYHSTFFSWFDVLQIKEMFLIAKDFMTTALWILVIAAVVVAVALIVVFRKQIGHFLKPHCAPLKGLLWLGVFVLLAVGIQKSVFDELALYPRTWENKMINVRDNGLIVNLIFDINTLKEAVIEKPGDYSEERAAGLSQEFSELNTAEESDIRPDVILILSESLFDLSAVPGIELDTKINATIEKYSTTDLVSPRFGGYTSAIEFEALTGMTLAFLPDALTPYTTYFNSSDEAFPSVVADFNENGYFTQAMHPNLADFYNRSVVYNSFGFDDYKSITAFQNVPQDMMTENGWVKDEYLGQRIIEELENSDGPQFLFGITMEGHYVSVDKYAETEVHVVDGEMSEQELHEIEQQAQSYYETDRMIAALIDYMDHTDRPTLLYVFGDHLPPITYLSTGGFVADKENKYTTSFVRYSNYKELDSLAEKISPNQIAAVMMHDAGIEHSSYFDYIYSLQDTYPVVQKEFVDMDSSDFDTYRFIQYDLMFGKKYLAQ